MKKTVQIYVKNVYGNTLRYPHNETAELLGKLTNQKTFSDSSLNIIRQLGYELELVAEDSEVLNS